MNQPNSRPYRSATRRKQAADTRRAILEVARGLFAEHGYAGTSLARIAEGASVSVQTIYNSVGDKRAVLLALDDLVDRSGVVANLQRRIAESDDPWEILTLTGRLRHRMMTDSGDIFRVLSAAALTDEDIAEAARAGLSRSRAVARRIAERIAEVGTLRRGITRAEAADTIYAVLHHDVWARLTQECGYRGRAYERWFADIVGTRLLGERRGPRRPRPL